MGAKGSCLPCCQDQGRCNRANSSSLKPTKDEITTSKRGGFNVSVKAIDGTSWCVAGVSSKMKVRTLKARLMEEDLRFATHRADLVYGCTVLGDLDTLGACGVTEHTRLLAVFTDLRVPVLVIGGGVAGRRVVEQVSPFFKDQWIVVIDPKEYTEHACGIVRALGDPSVWESLVMRHEDVYRDYGNVHFLQGLCIALHPGVARVRDVRTSSEFILRYDSCVVATGCNWGVSSSPSLWKPSLNCEGWDFDELTLDGRRQRIQAEHKRLLDLHEERGTVVIVGADYTGVETACDFRTYFPQLSIYVVDKWPRCLVQLPEAAAEYAETVMAEKGIQTFYNLDYDPNDPVVWEQIRMKQPPDITYVMSGWSPHNDFMPPVTVSSSGPGRRGGWCLTNTRLQVCYRSPNSNKPQQVWADGRVFAAGDCHYGAVIGGPRVNNRNAQPGNALASNTMSSNMSSNRSHGPRHPDYLILPVPKTALAASRWAGVVAGNIIALAQGVMLEEAVWPNAGGIIAVSLGTNDGVVAWKIKPTRDSGEVVLIGEPAVHMKEKLTWPSDKKWFIRPSKWLDTFLAGIPTGHRVAERCRHGLRLSSRIW